MGEAVGEETWGFSLSSFLEALGFVGVVGSRVIWGFVPLPLIMTTLARRGERGFVILSLRACDIVGLVICGFGAVFRRAAAYDFNAGPPSFVAGDRISFLTPLTPLTMGLGVSLVSGRSSIYRRS